MFGEETVFFAPFGRRPKATRRYAPKGGGVEVFFEGVRRPEVDGYPLHSARVARSADGDIGGYLDVKGFLYANFD